MEEHGPETVHCWFPGARMRSIVAANDGPISLLAAWLRNLGGNISKKVEVHTGCGGERGFFAQEPIDPEEVIIIVPPKCLIKIDETDATFFHTSLQTLGPAAMLAARLLQEGARTDVPTGRFIAYYHSLPKHIDVPLAWDAHDLLGLAGHHCALLALSRKKQQLMNDYTQLKVIAGFDHVSWDDFLWAMTVVGSRAFRMKGSTGAQLCLVPFADLANWCGADKLHL